MMSSRVSKTVVKIRGKRNAVEAEKWRHGKRRNPRLQQRIPSSQHGSVVNPSSPTGTPATHRRKRLRRYELSPLEKLPVEIVQQIFIWSENIDLALTSIELGEKLFDEHLHTVMATRLLGPVTGSHTPNPSEYDLANAGRLLNCRFVTLTWFRTWLRQASSISIDAVPRSIPDAELWLALSPSPHIMPPVKLIRRPFTPVKAEFLAIFVQSSRGLRDNSHYSELAHQGLLQAVEDGQVPAVTHLLSLGLRPTMEMLRSAVVDNGCHKDVVKLLVSARQRGDNTSATESSDLDLLDPVVWTWAEKAQARGEEKGSWLVSLLEAA